MFKSLRNVEGSKINNSGRSLVGETMQLEGDLRTSGSIDVAGLVNGNIFVSEMSVTETGSIRGSIEAATIEVNVDELTLGKSIRIRDIKVEEGIEVINAGGIPIASVEIPRALRSAEAKAAAVAAQDEE